MTRSPIYLGTVLLEANRWAAQRTPTYRVSEWLARSADAGFDGIELWENHAVLADAGELAALKGSALPVKVFNSYAAMTPDGVASRSRAAELARELRAGAVKFNVGPAAEAGASGSCDEFPVGPPLAARRAQGRRSASGRPTECPAVRHNSSIRPGEALERELRAVRQWAALMPGVDLLCECHPGTALEDPAVAAQALAAFPEIGVIVHPFSCPDLAAWIRHLGPRVRHAHVQVMDAQWRRWRLRDQAPLVRERLALLGGAGYAGSFTIEFTAGVGVAPEDRDALFAAACDDLACLREELK